MEIFWKYKFSTLRGKSKESFDYQVSEQKLWGKSEIRAHQIGHKFEDYFKLLNFKQSKDVNFLKHGSPQSFYLSQLALLFISRHQGNFQAKKYISNLSSFCAWKHNHSWNISVSTDYIQMSWVLSISPSFDRI